MNVPRAIFIKESSNKNRLKAMSMPIDSRTPIFENVLSRITLYCGTTFILQYSLC